MRRLIAVTGVLLLTGCAIHGPSDGLSGSSQPRMSRPTVSRSAMSRSFVSRPPVSRMSRSMTSRPPASSRSAASRPAAMVSVLLTGPDRAELPVRVEIADDEAEREQGLMNRTSLEGGMLFTFTDDAVRAFWMKDTLIPLDILYFDADGVFVSSVTMQPCKADPCTTYPSAKPARYALEVNAGYAAENGIGEGWSIRIPPAAPGAR